MAEEIRKESKPEEVSEEKRRKARRLFEIMQDLSEHESDFHNKIGEIVSQAFGVSPAPGADAAMEDAAYFEEAKEKIIEASESKGAELFIEGYCALLTDEEIDELIDIFSRPIRKRLREVELEIIQRATPEMIRYLFENSVDLSGFGGWESEEETLDEELLDEELDGPSPSRYEN